MHGSDEAKNSLRRFSPSEFYDIRKDDDLTVSHSTIFIYPEGFLLLFDYYKEKYNTAISRPASRGDEILDYPTLERRLYYLGYGQFIETFIKECQSKDYLLLKEIKENKMEEYREAFIIGDSNSHQIPVIYLKEGNKEMLLYANSISTPPKDLEKLIDLQKQTGIPVYVVKERRQADMQSCSVDAFILAKDATSKDSSGKFKIPNLLSQVGKRSSEEKGYFDARLPNELLKSAQLSKFIENQQETDSKKIVHEGSRGKETLKQFRAAYTFKDRTLKEGDHAVASYSKVKGEKLAALIEIEFYLIQLRWYYPKLMTPDNVKKFIIEGKKIARSQGLKKEARLHDFSLEFIKKLELENTPKQSNQTSRAGLFSDASNDETESKLPSDSKKRQIP